jgi:integrase/recombinase XerD
VKCARINHRVLSRVADGPFAAHLGAFAESQAALGYAIGTIQFHVRLATGFSRWLERRRIAAHRAGFEHGRQYLHDRARRGQSSPGEIAAIRHFLTYLRDAGVIAPEKVAVRRLTSAERRLEAYGAYLRDTRALASATIHFYLQVIRRFLTDRYGNGPVHLAGLTAEGVVGFVRREVARLRVPHAKHVMTALRSFLRYARYRGDITLDLAAAVPAVAHWSMTGIPRAIPAPAVRQLLASMDRRTATGRRDYAIVLLLAQLGLRAGEVAGLELEDLDWNVGQLHVRGKGHRATLPLPVSVGQAIAAYLRHGRPSSTSRRVFLRVNAPHRGFQGSAAIGGVVRQALRQAGIQAPTNGAHQFRHGLATEMLRRGASLSEIGGVLRHRKLDTTTIYAKVDFNALRTLALPWPGGVQ